MEPALVLSFISCSVGGTRTNLFISVVGECGGLSPAWCHRREDGLGWWKCWTSPRAPATPLGGPQALSWAETLYIAMCFESSSADFITTITKDHLTVNAGPLLLWINVINLSSTGVFSPCISSSLINKWRVKSLFCMLWYIPALLVLDKHSDTSLYAEIYDGAAVWERRGNERLLLRYADKSAGLDREMGVTRAQLKIR